MRSAVAAVVAVTVALLQPVPTAADGLQLANRPPQSAVRAAVAVDDTTVQALQALQRLHSFGYTINTPARAQRAIRHWQRVNGLAVTGIVTGEVLSSLGLTTPLGSAAATAPAVRDNLPPEQSSVEQIIREAWPDELEDHAVAIARRESRLQPEARNACCWGLFQIHWRAHRSWLATIGVTSSIQLLDAATNAAAAYQLYLRDGWRPWNL